MTCRKALIRTCLVVFLVLTTTAVFLPSVRGQATVPVEVHVNANWTWSINPLTAVVANGQTVTWISTNAIMLNPPDEIEVIVPGGPNSPFPAGFNARVAWGVNIVSPVAAWPLGALGTKYTINVFRGGVLMLTSDPYLTPPLSVSISPLQATICVGQSVTFTSNVTGGVSPYIYRWYVNGTCETGPWFLAFTPSAPGTYYVYLNVTDAANNIAQSETATIVVLPMPVGGYSFPVEGYTATRPLTPYLALIAILAIGFTIIRRKIPRKTK